MRGLRMIIETFIPQRDSPIQQWTLDASHNQTLGPGFRQLREMDNVTLTCIRHKMPIPADDVVHVPGYI